VPDAASAEFARRARGASCSQPSGEFLAIEQRDGAGVDLPGPSPGARRLLRESLEDRTIDVGARQRVGGQQTHGTGTDDPDIDFHAITTLLHMRANSAYRSTSAHTARLALVAPFSCSQLLRLVGP
jgi:hypothetical protein